MVIILAVQSDLTYQEIARAIGASERVVPRSIHSGLCRLAAGSSCSLRSPSDVELEPVHAHAPPGCGGAAVC